MNIEELFKNVIFAILGLGFILLGVMFAIFGLEYAALPLSLIGIIICINAMIKSDKKSKNKKPKKTKNNQSKIFEVNNMKKENLFKSIVIALLGIAVELQSIMLAKIGISSVAIILSIVGVFICIVALTKVYEKIVVDDEKEVKNEKESTEGSKGQ